MDGNGQQGAHGTFVEVVEVVEDSVSKVSESRSVTMLQATRNLRNSVLEGRL
jgi:hypothetical protein